MLLVILTSRSESIEAPPTLSVWVNTDDEAEAESRALAAMGDLGFTGLQVEALTPTSRDDYFRPCPSLDALEKAEAEGIAWRVPEP